MANPMLFGMRERERRENCAPNCAPNSTPELRVVLSQTGVAIELHRAGQPPVMLQLFRPEHIEAYGRKLAEHNPDMRYSSIDVDTLWACSCGFQFFALTPPESCPKCGVARIDPEPRGDNKGE